MKKLSPLKTGDIIDVIAPASKANDQRTSKAIEWLASLCYQVRTSKDFNKGYQLFANSKEQAWTDLKNALKAKDSKAIWCLRGGWGSMRFIPDLLKMKAPDEQKYFFGYSDITTLHTFLTSNWNWTTFHAPNLSGFGGNKTTNQKNEILNIIDGTNKEVVFKNLKLLNDTKSSIIKGKIVGGNLCMIASSLQTKLNINTKNNFLFLEDTGERGYQLDRYFEQLLQSDILNNSKAILLGDFTGGNEPNGKNFNKIAIKRLLEKVKVPVIKGLPCGHGKKNSPLPLNANSILDLSKSKLIIKTGN